MTVIGVLLMVIAALVVIAVLVGGSGENALLDMGLFDISTSTMGVFLFGAATVLIFASGMELLRSGLRRSLRRRRELKEARAVVAEQSHPEKPPGPGRHAAGPEDTDSTPTTESTDTAESRGATDTSTGPESDTRGSTP
jgi:uncharacterized membrane protein YciS (DUF1049 family)